MPTEREPIPRVDAVAGTHPAHEGPGGGPLILIGGAVTPRGHALRSFLDVSGALEGQLVVAFMTASANEEENAWYWTGAFNTVGATNVRIPTFDRAPNVDGEIAALVDDASAVFLGGGDQVKLVTALSGSCTGAAIARLHARGGAVCGTSAGAAALTELTMAGGEIDEEGNLVEQFIGPGLGLLGFGTIVDTHFSQRRRLQRLFLVIAANTELFGLGIDEDTALVVRDGIGEVVGAGGVTFVDGRDTVRFDNASELDKGRQLTLSHLRVGVVGTHYRLDLRARDVYEFLIREPSRHLR